MIVMILWNWTTISSVGIANMKRGFCKIFIILCFAYTSSAEESGCEFSDSEAFCINADGRFLNHGGEKRMHVMYIVNSDMTQLNPTDFALFDSVQTLSIFNSSLALPQQNNLLGGLKKTLKELRIEFCIVNETIKLIFAENSLIENLILTGNKISEITKDFLGHLHKLKEINLSQNEIHFIEPGSFEGLSSLAVLNLTSNKIGGYFDPKFLTMASFQCVLCQEKEDTTHCSENDFKRCQMNTQIDHLWWMAHSTEILLQDNPVCGIITGKTLPMNQSHNSSETHSIKEMGCMTNDRGNCFKHERRRMFLLDVCGVQDYLEADRGMKSTGQHEPKYRDDGVIVSSYAWFTTYIVLGIIAGSIIGVMLTALIIKRRQENESAPDVYYSPLPHIGTEDIDLEYDKFPLHRAALNGDVREVDYWIGKGETLSMVNKDGDTALHVAAKRNHLSVVDCLLKHEIDINKKNRFKETALHVASRENHIGIVKCLLNNGAHSDEFDCSGKTPLHHAIWHGNTEMVESLLERRANLRAKDAEGKSPLFLATKVGHVDIVKLLLERGADVGTSAEGRKTSLHVASWNGNATAVQLLLSHSAVVKPDHKGYTPLHNASRKGHVDVLRLFLPTSKPEDVNVEDEHGNTPLHQGARGGHLPVLQLLLCHGADVHRRNCDRKTPRDLAEEAHFLHCLEVLRGGH